MNSLIDLLEQILEEFGDDLPPIDKRKELWRAISNTRNKEMLSEFQEYVELNNMSIHHTFLGEIGRIIYD